MSTLEERVNQILEGMADFESRLSYIENLHTHGDASLNNSIEEIGPVEKEMVYTDNSQQLRAQITYLQKKIIDHINLHSKKKGTNDYY